MGAPRTLPHRKPDNRRSPESPCRAPGHRRHRIGRPGSCAGPDGARRLLPLACERAARTRGFPLIIGRYCAQALDAAPRDRSRPLAALLRPPSRIAAAVRGTHAALALVFAGCTSGSSSSAGISNSCEIWTTRLPGMHPRRFQSRTVVRATPSLSARVTTLPALSMRD